MADAAETGEASVGSSEYQTMATADQAMVGEVLEPAAQQEPSAVGIAVRVALGLAALVLAAQVLIALLSTHSLTQVESIIAIQARTLAGGGPLYYDLNAYPYTVSPYGPIYYCASAVLQVFGAAPLLAGRMISMAGLAIALWMGWRALEHWGVGRLERLTGLALAGVASVTGVWGVVGQSDMLALAFSMAAVERYARYEQMRRGGTLALAGLLIALAIFTKQSFLAAGAAVTLALLVRETRRGIGFTLMLGVAGVSTAVVVNFLTDGRYLANAILANLNPFAWHKLAAHLEYFGLATGALALVAACGLIRRGSWNLPLHLYLATSVGMWLLTAAKVGSDLNYQLEPTLVLALAAAWALHRLRFFELVAKHDASWVTLLQLPLVVHLIVNTGASFLAGSGRVVLEQLAREQTVALAPWLESEGRVLTVEIDPLVHAGRTMEVEPLIYTLLVNAGVTSAGPVTRDLQTGAFAAVMLYHDVNDPAEFAANPETPSLPEQQLAMIRNGYELVAHVPGPLLDGVYVYEPRKTADEPSQANSR